MSRHISEQFEEELQSARNLLMEMGGLVEQQVRNAYLALARRSEEKAQKVRTLERRVNGIEKALDDLCVHIIARRQPAASDLRTTISIMRSSNDLERVGDEAERIAKLAQRLESSEEPPLMGELQALQEAVSAMLRQVLDAFARNDQAVAAAVIAADKAVDQQYRALNDGLVAHMRTHPEQIDLTLALLWTARALERIGDHAKNVGEYVVYLVSGEDVRHSKPGQAD